MCLSKEVYSNSNVSPAGYRDGGLDGASSRWSLEVSGGEVPSRLAIFCNFLEKKAIPILLDHILHVFRAI